MDYVQPHLNPPPPPPTNVDYVFLLYQLWHISWKKGTVDLVKVKKKNRDIGLGLKPPPPLLDLVHQNVFFYFPKNSFQIHHNTCSDPLAEHVH